MTAFTILSHLTCLSTVQEKPTAEEKSHQLSDGTIAVYPTPTGMEMHLNTGATLNVEDYAQPEEWNRNLQDIAGAQSVKQNDVYQYHVNIAREQYDLALTPPEAITMKYGTKDGVLTAQGIPEVQGSLLTGFAHEAARLPSGLYSDLRSWYGNMELGDQATVEQQLLAEWKTIAAQEGWGPLEDLDAYQWMQIIQERGAQLAYDPSLVAIYPEYDPEATEKSQNLTISELMAANRGVCRDVERLNVTSYMLADRQFDLADRGLLYMPVLNSADAKHTRGMFLLAADEDHTVVVGVDTTNADGLTWRRAGDASPQDVTAWYGQGLGKEWLSPEGAKDFYTALLLNYTEDLSPTPRAIAQRELLAADLQLAADALSRKKPEEKRRIINTAFWNLKNQIDAERMQEVFPLTIADRQSRLCQILLFLAVESGVPENQALAMETIALLGESGALEGTSVADLIDGIDVFNPNQKAQAKVNVQGKIDELRARIGKSAQDN